MGRGGRAAIGRAVAVRVAVGAVLLGTLASCGPVLAIHHPGTICRLDPLRVARALGPINACRLEPVNAFGRDAGAVIGRGNTLPWIDPRRRTRQRTLPRISSISSICRSNRGRSRYHSRCPWQRLRRPASQRRTGWRTASTWISTVTAYGIT